MELLKKCFVPVFTAILVAIANYLYIGPLENKIEKITEANNIVVDIIIEDTIYMYRNFPKYFDIIRKKNLEGALSSDADQNLKEREEILLSYEPNIKRLAHIYILISILSREESKTKNIEAFKSDIEGFNGSFLGSTNIDIQKISENRSTIEALEKKFFKTMIDISEVLQDYISKR